MDCPLCLEPVLEGARQCDNCGADLTSSLAAGPPESVKPEPSGTPDSEAPSTPTAVETSPLRDAGRQGPDPSGESAKSFLYLCPSCGELVRAEDASCAKCGVSLREDVRP